MTNTEKSAPDANSAQPKRSPPTHIQYFVIWYDYVDGRCHGRVLKVPLGKDPESVAFSYLSKSMEVNDFAIEDISEILKGEMISEY